MEKADKEYFDSQFDEIKQLGPRLDKVEDRLTKTESNVSWIMRIGGTVGAAVTVVVGVFLKKVIGD